MGSLKTMGIYLATLILVFTSAVYIIPDLKINLNSYTMETKILQSTDYKTYKSTYRKWYKNPRRFEDKEQTNYTLILTMTDGSQYSIESDKASEFPALSDPKSTGKTFKLYTDKNNKPVQIEIDNQLIYGLQETNESNYLILAFTLGMILYSIARFKRIL